MTRNHDQRQRCGKKKKKNPANTTRGDVLTPKISTLCCSSTLKVNKPPSSKSVPLQQRCRRRARCRSDAQELESHHRQLRRVSRLRPAPQRVAAQTRTDRGCGRMGGSAPPSSQPAWHAALGTTVREKLTPGHARRRERGGMA